MPIVSTNTVSKEIASLLFNANDTLVVTLTTTVSNGTNTTEAYTLEADVVRGLLDAPPLEGYTLRQSIIAKVYMALLALNLVQGQIQAG